MLQMNHIQFQALRDEQTLMFFSKSLWILNTKTKSSKYSTLNKRYYVAFMTLHLPLTIFCKHPHATLSCSNPRHQPSLHIINGFKQCQKGDFTSSTVTFYQKSIFDFLNPFTNISGYLKGTLVQIWKFLYVLIHIKIISWKFCILNPKNCQFIHLNLWNVCLQTYKNNKIC